MLLDFQLESGKDEFNALVKQIDKELKEDSDELCPIVRWPSIASSWSWAQTLGAMPSSSGRAAAPQDAWQGEPSSADVPLRWC